MKKNKRGSISIYVTFITVAIFVVLIGAVFAPMGILFNTEMFKAGEGILNRSSDSIAGIQDVEVRNSVLGITQSAKDSYETNVEVNGALFQYSWLIVLVLTGLVLFLFTRRIVEFQGGGSIV